MPKAKETILEINLNHLEHNFNFLKSRVSEDVKFLAVVKAFAYGNDASNIALFLQSLNADYFAVAYADEGKALRKAGVTKPILVFHPQKASLKKIVKYNLEPNLYSKTIFEEFLDLAERKQLKNYPVHLKFNTGLNRLGFIHSDIDYLTSKLNNSKAINVASIFSHLAASEDENEKEFTLQQIEKFKRVIHKLTSQLSYKPIIHMCNTSGIINYPEAHFNMVRSGIGLYGFGNSKSINKELKPIASLKSIISQIHHVKEGESVGYNRTFISTTDKKIATIPIGHADGISRIYGNKKGFVYINNQKAYIIGNVCMDMIMVDISSINCTEGDEVVIFDEHFSADDLATNASTISYELITSISQRVKRKLIK